MTILFKQLIFSQENNEYNLKIMYLHAKVEYVCHLDRGLLCMDARCDVKLCRTALNTRI